jgi:hypothetical protein
MRADVDLLALMWQSATDPYFEVARGNLKRWVTPWRDALDRVDGDELRYAAPYPHATRTRGKAGLAGSCDVLWADLDNPDRSELDLALESLKSAGVHPSALVDSGNRGWHLYWKLSRAIPQQEHDGRLRQVARYLEADMASAESSRLLRIPGYEHPKSGRLCQTLELDGRIHDPTAFDALGPLDEVRPLPDMSGLRLPRNSPSPTTWWLPDPFRDYLAAGDLTDELAQRYPSRSEAEAAMVYWACREGFGDDAIVGLALGDGWPKATEKAASRPHEPEHWIRRAIDDVRHWLFWYADDPYQTSRHGGKPRRAKRLREWAYGLDRIPPRGQPPSEYKRELQALWPDQPPDSRRKNAANWLSYFQREGWVTLESDRVRFVSEAGGHSPSDRRAPLLGSTAWSK